MRTSQPYPQGSILRDNQGSLWLIVSEPRYFSCLKEYIVAYVSVSQTPSHQYKTAIDKLDLEGLDQPISVSTIFATVSAKRLHTKVGQISEIALQEVKQMCCSTFAFHEENDVMSLPQSAHPSRIVLVNFPYADTEGDKQRPAIVVSNLDYFRQTKRITVLMITSREQKAKCETDRVILRWQEAGLDKPSTIRCRPASVLTDRAYPVGWLQPNDFDEALSTLKQALGI